MRLLGPDCRCRSTVELATAALEAKELPPKNCPTHAPNVEEEAREARRRDDHWADLQATGRRIHADRPQPDPEPSLRSIVAAAFGAAPEAERSTPPALNSDALLDSLRARLGIPDDDLPPAA